MNSLSTSDGKPIETHNLIVDFGKHKGERWTRVPIGYLKWLINEGTPWAPIAKAELERRGGVIDPSVVISGHAIDRASLRCVKIWEGTRLHNNEGLYAWLHRMATEALEHDKTTRDLTNIRYRGMQFSFDHGEVFPTLKSVYPSSHE